MTSYDNKYRLEEKSIQGHMKFFKKIHKIVYSKDLEVKSPLIRVIPRFRVC